MKLSTKGYKTTYSKIVGNKIRVKKTNKKLIGTVIIAIVFLIAFGFSANFASLWFRDNTIVFNPPVTMTFQKPVEFISLSELKRRQDVITIADSIATKCVNDYFNPPVLAPQVNDIDPQVFFDVIWKNESNRGSDNTINSLAMYCRSRGGWNEIGYDPQQKYCFRDREESERFVAYFVKKNCDGKTMESCECYWNTGSWLNECAYSKGDLSMAN